MVGDPNVSEIVFSTENGQFATVGEVPVDYAPTTRPWFKLAMEKKAKWFGPPLIKVRNQKNS